MKIGTLLRLLVLAGAVTACSAPQVSSPATPESATKQSAPTPTSKEPTRRPTDTLPVQPAETHSPTPTIADAMRIRFAPGATSKTLTDHVVPEEIDRYVLRASEGQVMHVRIFSAEEAVRVRVDASSGAPLEEEAAGRTFWRGPLPVTQDYVITVSSQEAANYELSIIIYSRIEFEPGATSTTIHGRLGSYETDHYVFHARAGQILDIAVNAPEQVGLTVWGADGVPLKRYVDEEMSWRGELPVTQDYFVELNALEPTRYTLTLSLPPSPSKASVDLLSPDGGEDWLEGSIHDITWRSSGIAEVDIEVASGGKPLGYAALGVDASSGVYSWEIPVGLVSNFGVAASDAMRVRVVSSDDPDVYDENDQPFTVRCPRIESRPLNGSVSVTGTLSAENGQFRYVLEATEGRTMDIRISPIGTSVDVWGSEDGSMWEIPERQDSLTIPSLPASQDYFITLANPDEGEAVDYILTIVVQK